MKSFKPLYTSATRIQWPRMGDGHCHGADSDTKWRFVGEVKVSILKFNETWQL